MISRVVSAFAAVAHSLFSVLRLADATKRKAIVTGATGGIVLSSLSCPTLSNRCSSCILLCEFAN